MDPFLIPFHSKAASNGQNVPHAMLGAANNNTGFIPDIFFEKLGSTLEVLTVAGKCANP